MADHDTAEIETFGERLRHVRRHLGLTQKQLSGPLGIKAATVAQLEVGRHLPSAGLLTELFRAYRVNPTWLLTGEAPMTLEPYVVGGRKAWLTKEDAAALGAQPPESVVIPPTGFVSVPILGAIAALGLPIENDHERPEGPPALLLKSKVRHPRDTYALRVRGDSMLPTLCDGFLVFVDRNMDALRPLKALDGKLVVVRLDQGSGGISIKRVEVGRNALTITADHPEAGFAPVALRLDQADRILAKVIGWWGEQ